MEDSYKIRKDRVKNIAIIFLVVMLVLTFFSNSILNRSLPEVATAYVERGTITEKIRGNGIVEAQDPYKIVATGSRKISSVPIKEGDMVTKDQILFQLEDAESDELKQAEADLDQLILTYTTAILNGQISNESFNTIQSGNLDSINGYQAQIEAARQKVKACQASIDAIRRQQLLNANEDKLQDTDPVNLQEAISKKGLAEAAMTEAQNKISSTKESMNKLLVVDGTTYTIDQLKSKKTNAYNLAMSYQPDYLDKKNKIVTSFSGQNTIKNLVEELFSKDEWQLFIGEEKDKLQQYIAEISDPTQKNTATDNYTQLFVNMVDGITLYENYKNAIVGFQKYQSVVDQYPILQIELNTANEQYTNAKSDYDYWTRKVSELTGEQNESIQSDNDLAVALADAEAALAAAEKEQNQLLTDIGQELNLSSQNSIIADKQKEIAELREKTVGATIVSPVDGMVLSVSKVAGEEIAADEEIATIQVAGKDMMVSFPVTKEQASKVKVGDKATLQNSWYYDGVEVTLYKIKPDKDNPSKNKILEFIVKGDVQNGESLGLEIGQRSKDYDYVVPNSAVREDKKGKFILIIEEKSTPFGNRYKAKRYNVEVLASDETNSAIGVDGELQGWEYVITTSNIPVESGSQVRLAEY